MQAGNEIIKNKVMRKAPKEFTRLLERKLSGELSLKDFRLKLYYTMADNPERWLSNKPDEIFDNDYMLTRPEDLDTKIAYKFFENYYQLDFLKTAVDELKENGLDIFAEMFEKRLLVFYVWFAKFNINVKTRAVKHINDYLFKISIKFKTWLRKEREKNKGHVPKFKFYNLKTGDYEFYNTW